MTLSFFALLPRAFKNGFITFLSFCALLTPSAYAYNNGIHFFRSNDSLFPSGISAKKDLLKNILETYTERWFLVDESLWSPESNVLSYHDFIEKIECPAMTAMYKGRDTSKEPDVFCERNESLEVLEHQNTRFRVKRANGQIRWIDDKQVKASNDNLGFAYNPSISSLDSLESPARLRIAPFTKLKILSYKNNLVEVEWNKQRFRCPRSLLITPLDIASDIAFKSGTWKSIQKLDSNRLYVDNKAYKIPNKPVLKLDEKKIIIQSNAYFYSSASYQSKQRNHYSGNIKAAKNTEEVLWVRSYLKPHGEVFWRDEVSSLNSSQKISDSNFFERTIFDMAASPIKTNLLFASAGGVFKKTEGALWQKIDLFGNEDYPIVFARDGRLIIGPYYSDDHGESFKPYVQWHSVLKRLGEQGQSIDSLKIKKVSSLDKSGHQIRMIFDSQKKEHEIQWNLLEGDWKLVR